MPLIRVLFSFPGLRVRGERHRFYWGYVIEEFGAVWLCVLDSRSGRPPHEPCQPHLESSRGPRR